MEIRHIRPEEVEQAVKLTDLVFRSRDPDKKSYAESHPLVFAPGLGQSFGVYEGGRLVSFIGLVPSIVKIGPAAVACYSIGGVCTHPDYRGKGYAEHALRAVTEHVEQAGASLLLVSGERGLYSRAHCYPFGSVSRLTLKAGTVEQGGDHALPRSEVSAGTTSVDAALAGTAPATATSIDASAGTASATAASIDAASGAVSAGTTPAIAASAGVTAAGAEPRDGLTIREMRDTDWLRVRTAAAGRLCAFEQSVWDLALLLRAEAAGTVRKQSYKLLIAERNDEMLGYAVIGIPYAGADSEAAAIEWAGDGGTVAALLREALSRYGLATLSVPVPWHEKELLQELSGSLAAAETNGGTVKVISPERLLRQLLPYLQHKAGDAAGRLRFETAGNGRVLVALAERSAVLEPSAFVSLLFDPEPAVGIEDDKLNLALRKLFPVPFPYTYGLNYI
ncbi:GNAT family N-acetyltransferase [Paenibacillus contaminans]|nr:GNAT family N-acetyltransferase [Paenibacillus contaminans]